MPCGFRQEHFYAFFKKRINVKTEDVVVSWPLDVTFAREHKKIVRAYTKNGLLC